MKVAFLTYPAAFQNVGGGEIQLLKTKEYLESAGLEIRLFDFWHDKVELFDILHIFSSVGDCLGLAQTAKLRKVKVVVSPVLWSDWRRAFKNDTGLKDKLELTARHWAKVVMPSFPSPRRRLLQIADRVLPNSVMEKDQIARLFAISPNKMHVVYNGVDRSFCDAEPALFRSKYGEEPFLLSVGRIEPRKNQLALIRAVRRLGKPRLILIGNPVTGYEKYFELCRREGQGFVTVIPALSHTDPLLRSAYAACHLFVLPAWFETPGLAALEAILAGARVLVTQGGSTREYFLGNVEYLDPSNPKQIALKIQQCLASPRNETLRKRVLDQYTWPVIAEQHLGLYRECLKG